MALQVLHFPSLALSSLWVIADFLNCPEKRCKKSPIVHNQWTPGLSPPLPIMRREASLVLRQTRRTLSFFFFKLLLLEKMIMELHKPLMAFYIHTRKPALCGTYALSIS